MDLDKIKETWQSAELKSSIDEDRIQHILDSRSQTALDTLVKFENRFQRIGIACILFLPMFWYMHKPLFWIYLITVFIGCFWQQHKLELLKNISLHSMGILEVSSHITKYKNYLLREFIIGIVWIIAFMGLLCYFEITDKTPLGKNLIDGNLYFSIYFAFLIILALVIVILIYYKVYWKNIKAIQRSIKEIKSFEIDNH